MGVPDDELSEFALKEIEFQLTDLLRQISVEDIAKPTSFGREQAVNLCVEILKIAPQQPLLQSVTDTATILKGLLQNSDVSSLSESVKAVENSKQEDGQEEENEDAAEGKAGLLSFLKLHRVGMALMADAVKRMKAGETELEGELHVASVRDLLNDVKKLQQPWGVEGLEETLLPFVKGRASGRDESSLMQKHRLSIDMMMKEFFIFLQEGFVAESKNSISGCVEVLLELWGGRSEAKDAVSDENKNDSEFSLQEIIDQLRLKQYLCHDFWAAVDSQLPDSLAKQLEDFTKKTVQFGDLVHYVFASRKVIPGQVLQETQPSADLLRIWAEDLTPSMQSFFDSREMMERCIDIFAGAAKEDLQKLVLSCFADVGRIVSECHGAALSSMDSMAAAFSEALAFEAQAKLSLPQQGVWARPLTCFFEALNLSAHSPFLRPIYENISN